tara:strand:+ start:6376 stop:8277 length:1902 start_codon:yes stop_codon:yes gene_type:complete
MFSCVWLYNMSNAPLSQLAAYYSAHNGALARLNTMKISLWDTGLMGAAMFAFLYEHGSQFDAPQGTDKVSTSYQFQGSLRGDIAVGANLEVKLPALFRTAEGGANGVSTMWVWGVGYAMLRSATLNIGGHPVESLHGDYCEMASELHGTAGKYLQEHTMKIDRVTIPDMVAMSCSQTNTMYIPLPFFFTRSAACVLPIGKLWGQNTASAQVTIEIKLRAIADIAVCLNQNHTGHLGGLNNSSEVGTMKGLITNSDGSQNIRKADGNALDWKDIKLQLWLSMVLLDDDAAKRLYVQGGKHRYQALTTTAIPLAADADSSVTISDGARALTNLQMLAPIKNLMWAIGDKKRTDAMPTSSGFAAGDPFTGDSQGVRKLMGSRMNSSQTMKYLSVDDQNNGLTYETNFRNFNSHVDSEHINIDWNTPREGSKVIATLASAVGTGDKVTGKALYTYPVHTGHTPDGHYAHNDADITGTHQSYITGSEIRSSKSPKTWRNDGLAGCQFLPGNRFDYRAHDTASEVEPIKSIVLKLNGKDRWDLASASPASGRASHFRLVQPMAHFNRVPRKGIYAYSFCKDASSPKPTGHVNLQNIRGKDLQVVLNSQAPSELIMYGETVNILTLDFEKQDFSMAFGRA